MSPEMNGTAGALKDSDLVREVKHGLCSDSSLNSGPERMSSPSSSHRERDGDAGRAGACGPADTMHIDFGHVRPVKIDHMADAVNVDATCSGIRGDENPNLAAKRGKRALILRLVPVNGACRHIGPG